jgi:tetratricopeptide (TPR) repeat protein
MDMANSISMKGISTIVQNKMAMMVSMLIVLIFSALVPSVLAKESTIDINSLLIEGNNLFNLEKYEDAISYYDKILAIEPDNVTALGKKGDAFALLGRSSDAIILYGQVIDIKKDHEDSGKLYADKILELDPQNINGLLKKGESIIIYYDKLDEALSYFDKVLVIDPNNVQALFDKGEVYFQLDKFDEAISWYDKALTIDPNHASSLSGKGYSLSRTNDLEQANFYLDKALALEPDNVDVLYKKGSTLLVQKNGTDALTYFHKALTIEPEHFYSLVKLKLVAEKIPYEPLDGFAEAIIRDSNGALVAHIKVRNLTYLDHKIVDDMINKWPVVKTINRDGKDYEVHQLVEEFHEDNRYLRGGSTHYGIYFPGLEGISLIKATYWQYQVEQGDTVTLIRTVFRPI